MKIEYQHHSKKEKQVFVVTSLESISNAIKILGNISTVPPEKIKFYNQIFIPLIKEKYSIQVKIGERQNVPKLVEDTQTLTANEIAEKFTKVFHKPMTPKQVQENYLKPLTDEGILEWKENPDNKRQYLYFVSSKLTVNNLEEMNRQLIDSVDNHFAYIWSYLVRPFQLSTKSGKMIRIFDAENQRISYLEFKKKISGNIMKSIDN